MKFALIISILFSSQLSALEVEKNDGKIVLKDVSCDKVADIAKSIAEWTKNTKEKDSCPPLSKPQRKSRGLGKCELDITNCIPAHVAKYQGVRPESAGPNCWNLALVMKGILPNLRYTTPEEMAFYMNPPLCRQLKNDEAKIPGDLGAIRAISGNSSKEYHGFIYISDKVAYSKNGYSTANPYTLQTLENVYDVYGVPGKKECRENELNYSKQCNRAASYFRCISMDEYLKQNPNTPEKIMSALNTIKDFEGCVESRAFTGSEFSDAATAVITDSSKALAFYLEEELKANQSENTENTEDQEKRNFLLGSLQLKLSAVAEQLRNLQDYGLSNEVREFANNIKKSLDELKGNTI